LSEINFEYGSEEKRQTDRQTLELNVGLVLRLKLKLLLLLMTRRRCANCLDAFLIQKGVSLTIWDWEWELLASSRVTRVD